MSLQRQIGMQENGYGFVVRVKIYGGHGLQLISGPCVGSGPATAFASVLSSEHSAPRKLSGTDHLFLFDPEQSGQNG